MLTILLKLPRTEKFSIGTEVKTSMYEMMKNNLLANFQLLYNKKHYPVTRKNKKI